MYVYVCIYVYICMHMGVYMYISPKHNMSIEQYRKCLSGYIFFYLTP